MIDILTVNPSDRSAVHELVTVLKAHLSHQERQYLFDALTEWEASISADARTVMTAYAAMADAGTYCPVTAGAYEMLTADLRRSPKWLEMLEWRSYILELTSVHDRKAA